MKMITAHIFFDVFVLFLLAGLISWAFGASSEVYSKLFYFAVGFLVLPFIFGVKRTGRHRK